MWILTFIHKHHAKHFVNEPILWELTRILRKIKYLKEIAFIGYHKAKENLEDAISLFIIFATKNKNESYAKT